MKDKEKNISLDGHIAEGVFKHFGKNPKINIWYSKGITLKGAFLGKLCLKCGKEHCDCGIEYSNHFSIPIVKKVLNVKMKTLDLTKIWRKRKSIPLLSRSKDFKGIAFELKNGFEFYLFLNEDGFLEIKKI